MRTSIALARPAGGGPCSIGCSVTLWSTGAPDVAKLNGLIHGAWIQPSIIRWATEKCGSGSSLSISSQPPGLRPPTAGAYWSPRPRLWPNSCASVSWISRSPAMPHSLGMEMTPRFLLPSLVAYGPQWPMLA
jgi:hypothetical protein